MNMRIMLTILCLMIAATASAKQFNCLDLPFGEDLAAYDGFIQYMEKDGVAYHNYTGACRLPSHKYGPVSLVYATVDGKLYAEIALLFKIDEEVGRALLNEAFGPMAKEYQDGDWKVGVWKDTKKDLTLKAKRNIKTGISKYVYYYNPLKEQLNKQKKEQDVTETFTE